MDEHYDSVGAEQRLKELIEERTCRQHMHLSKADVNKLSVLAIDKPQSWKLSVAGDEDGEPEEAVFRLQGIICAKDLPPISRRRYEQFEARSQAKYMKQAISMTGLGTTGFKDTIAGLTKVFDLYTTTFEENRLETWTATEFSGSPAIDMATRYFTPVQDAPDKASVPFNHDVDPAGLLTRLMGNTFIHASDNDVIFFKKRETSDGKWTFDPASTSAFAIGDIVESQVVVQCVSLKGGAVKMVVSFAVLAILDDSFRKDATRRRQNARVQANRSLLLKRRVGYEDEEESQPKSKESKTMDVVDTAIRE